MGNESSTMLDDSVLPETLSRRSLKAVAEYIKSGEVRHIVVMTGAGISTAAGIPDFRSPKTGLYANLARLDLPYAEAVFDITYFRQHPKPFYVLAKELYPGKFHPTVSHAFIALLAKKGLLKMLFTQNIDCLERVAGVPADKIIEAHGSFATQRCIECATPYDDEFMKEHVMTEVVPTCLEKGCDGLVKPDIVFFGEQLPESFRNNTHVPAMADLAIVLGTSLSVYPFAGLPEAVRKGVPRVLFNMEQVGEMGRRADDVVELGSCDSGVRKLASLLGWRDELESLWRGMVGEKEAYKQLSKSDNQEELEEEIKKMTEEVEAVLKLDSQVRPENDTTKEVEQGQVARLSRIMGGDISKNIQSRQAAAGASLEESDGDSDQERYRAQVKGGEEAAQSIGDDTDLSERIEVAEKGDGKASQTESPEGGEQKVAVKEDPASSAVSELEKALEKKLVIEESGAGESAPTKPAL